MAGELCDRGCAWCGRCDAEPDYACDCGRADCVGDCSEFIEANRDERPDPIDDSNVVEAQS